MQKQLDALTGVDKASKAASASAKAWAGQLDLQSKSFDRLRASLDPVYASSKRYEAAVEQAKAAVRSGIVTQKEANKVLGLASERYLGAAGSMKVATGPARGFMGLFSKERSNDLRQVALQLSQIGQHGAVTGDYLHAASIQAADIGLSFGMIGVAAGTAISVLGPMALSFLEIGEASTGLEDSLSKISELSTGLSSDLDLLTLNLSELTEKYGENADKVRELTAASAEFRAGEIRDALRDQVAELGSVSNSFISAESNGRAYVLAMEKLASRLGVTTEEARQYNIAVREMQDLSSFDAQIEKLEEIVQMAKAGGVELGKFPPELRAALISMIDLSNESDALKQLLEGTTPAIERGTTQTHNWAGAMAGVNAEIQAIMSSLSAIGGGLISNATKQAEVDALKAGKSIRGAAIEAERFRKELEFDARREGATWLERQAIDAEQYQFEHGIALDAVLDKEREAARSRERNLKKTGSASRKATNQLKKEADAVRASLDPMAAYNHELAELAKLQGLLSKDEMAKAVANLNVELADSLPLVGDLTDTLTEGLFNGFEGTLKDIGQTFKNWLIQMISTAAKNRIMLSLGFGGSLAGTAASAAGGLGGGSGILGGGGGGLINIGANLLGGGQIAQGIMSGLGGVFTGGGLTSSFANLGGLVSGASSGLGAFGAALPALGIIAGGIAILSKGLSREYDGRAVRGSLGPDGFDGFEFDFWDGGFLRGDKQVNHTARPEIQSMLDDGALAVRSSVEEMAAALGLASTAIDDFTADGFTIWLTGPNAGSEEQIAKAFEDQLTRLGDGMADLVLETEDYAKAGEGAYDTLTRLGGSLITANEGFGLLNQSLFEGSLRAAESASALMDAFGGVEQFTVSVGSYFELMFTDVERLAKQQQYAQEALDEAAEKLNLTLPTTHEAFRNLVAGLDRTTEEGREAYVTLIGLSDEFSVVHGTAQQAADALNGVGDALSQAEAEARRLKEQNIRDALAELTGAIKEAVDEMQDRLGIISDRLKLRLKRLQISVGAERDSITASHTALMDQLEGRLGTLEGAAEKSRQLFETLDDAIRDRRRIDVEGREVERRRALMYVQNGGSDPDRLSDALSVLGEDNSADFSNYADFLADYYRTSNIISERGDAAQTEMTAADMAVSALEQQIALAQSQHEAEMQRLDQILADGQRTYELAMGEYIAAINVENAVTQLNHTAERYTLVSERIETRMAELETIRLNMEQMVAATLDPTAGLPSISEGVFNVVGAVNALGGSIGQMAAGVAAVASAQKEANRIAQIKALERTQVVNSRPGAARAAGEIGTIGGALEAVGEIRALREEMAGYLGPISKATGATERSLKRVERDGLTTKGAA
ncbi:hypothetical protein [Phaeobacter inhibens]|nr:hypothetical protein [Phaeobacter inhibens]